MTNLEQRFEIAKREIETTRVALEVMHDCGFDPVITAKTIEMDVMEMLSNYYKEIVCGLHGDRFISIEYPNGSSIQLWEKSFAEKVEAQIKSSI